jgi:S-DNA-T family DNA segregation ATPase FtsK/SpoIIIE
MNGELLVNTLKDFGINTRLSDVTRGPAVTRYELEPSAGVKISRITGLADDIALRLATTGVRIEAPIPNKAAVGIEVPNKARNTVCLRSLLDTADFRTAKGKLTVALGQDIEGNTVMTDLAKMPHLLIAGTTGSGKSVCTNSMIQSVLFRARPDEVKMILIDPKKVEFGVYNGIPHLLIPVVTDPRKAAAALNWAVTEMLKRYQMFADAKARDIGEYNELARKDGKFPPLPLIMIVIDELADLMMAAGNEVEDSICRLAQMARAAGMHMVIATQRPSVDVITGLIKGNIPSRLALTVASGVDSRTILDGVGAEKLLGNGDMLFMPVGQSKPLRVQGCYVSNQEIERVIEFLKNGGQEQEYDQQVIEEIEKAAASAGKSAGRDDDDDGEEFDEALPQAIEIAVEAGSISTSMLQRKLRFGYARAGRIIDQMEQRGIIGPSEGSKPRKVLITRQQWIEMNMNNETE